MKDLTAPMRDSTGGRLMELLLPHARRLGLIVLLLLALVGTNLVLPYAVKVLIDDVFPHDDGTGGNWGLLWLILPAVGLIYVVRNSLFFPSQMLSVQVAEDVCFSMRRQLFDYLQQLNLKFHKSHQPGKISSRLLDDTFKIQTFIQEKLPTLMINLFLSQVLLIILYAVNWRLALASSIVLPLHFVTYWFFKHPIRRTHSESQETVAAAYGNVIEKFMGMEVVKGFAGEEKETARFHNAIDASRQSQIRTRRYEFMQKVVADLLVGAGVVFLFGFGAWQVMNGQMTGGTFIMFFGYVGMLYPAVLDVISGTTHLSKATASVDRVFEMLQEPGIEAVHDRATDEISIDRGEVEYHGVSFSYGHNRPILRNLSLHVRAGERIAITGPSGSGKSTAVSMLPRFVDPVGGKVLIDGRDVRSIPITKLRQAIGIAFQETFLFDASIEENLRYARADATHEEIRAMCELTGAHKFIERHADKYDTRIGPYGTNLSRGERQRINLARALLKNPKILVLDEALASIDQKTSSSVLRAIFQKIGAKTVIMITHNPNLIKLADRVVILKDGRVEFDGPATEYSALEYQARVPEGPEAGSDSPETESVKGAQALANPVQSVADDEPDGEANVNADKGGQPMDTDMPTPSELPTTRSRSRSSFSSRVRGLGHRGTLVVLTALMTVGMLVGACVQESATSQRSFEVSQPRTTGGLMLSTDRPDRTMDRLVAAIDEAESKRMAQSMSRGTLEPTREEMAFALMAGSDMDRGSVGVAVGAGMPSLDGEAESEGDEARSSGAVARRSLPPGAGRLLPLGRLSPTEIAEIIENLALSFRLEHGYRDVAHGEMTVLNEVDDLGAVRTLNRVDAQGLISELRFGFVSFASQPSQLSIVGLTREPDTGTEAVNPDVETALTKANELIASSQIMREGLTPGALANEMIKLSYIDTKGAAAVLKGLGVTVVDDAGAVPQDVNFDSLPIVVQMPSPTKEQIGLVGSGSANKGTFGMTQLPQAASELAPDTIMTPTSQLLVLYHEAHPEQLSLVRNLLNDVIDRPARQVFVEGLVLEISEDGLDELGIEWEFNEGPISWMIGKLIAGGVGPTFDFSRVDSVNTSRDWAVNIRALVRDGKAEILSRPGVLTVDNRQAAIRVGEDIPIATSQEGNSNSNKVAFRFEYIPTGIMLNIRPRITEVGNEVSMLIDTVVSAVVPGRDLEIRDNNGDLLATAPTISTRRVQTYARVENNSPYIIGGLVSRDMTITQDKVPLLGDLPFIGAAFRAERTQKSKREVIIVLTPYVIPDDRGSLGPIPKGDTLFDSFGNALFQDSYRIRPEDVFDLSFLPENERLKIYVQLAEQVVRGDSRLAHLDPYAQFVNGHIPGEEIIVHRMIYEVIKRLDRKGEQLDLNALIDANRIIYFEGQQIGGYSVQFLERVMSKIGEGPDYRSFFENKPNKALAFTYHYDRESDDPAHLGTEPIPDVVVYDCPDRATWAKLLWELNQPNEVGRKRFTVLLNNESDLTRLRRAIVLKKVIMANGGWANATLQNFKIGNVLRIPELEPGQTTIIDVDVARLFFHTEHYYTAALKEIERAIGRLDRDLHRPEIRPLLGPLSLPESAPNRP